MTVRGGGRQAFLLALPPQTQQAKFLTWQFDGEYRGDDYTATLTLGNPDLIGESGEELGRGCFFLVAAHLLVSAVAPHGLEGSGVRSILGRLGGGERAWLPSLRLTLCLPRCPTVIMVAHFLQSLTHRLVLGGELVYHRRPGEEGAILTLAGKYSGMG